MDRHTAKGRETRARKPLTAAISREDGVTIIAMAGPVDHSTEPVAAEQISKGIADDQRVVLDLSQATGDNRVTLRILKDAFRRAQHLRARLCVAGLSPDLARVLADVGLVPHIAVEDDVRSCVRSVRKDHHDNPGT